MQLISDFNRKSGKKISAKANQRITLNKIYELYRQYSQSYTIDKDNNFQNTMLPSMNKYKS